MCNLFLRDCESNIINYADDTTLYACEPNMDLVSSKLEIDTFTVFTWFQNNYLQANRGKSHRSASSGKSTITSRKSQKYTPWREYQSACLRKS